MSLSILSSAVTALLAVLTYVFVSRRHDQRPSKWAWIVVILALTSFFLAASQTWYAHQEKTAAPFAIGPDDIRLTLYASRHPAYESDQDIIAGSPDGMPDVQVFIGSFWATTDFVRVQGVQRPWGYRAPARATVLYHSVNLRRSRQEDERFPFEHIWDLDSAMIMVTMPLHRFRGETERNDWHFSLEVMIKDYVFVGELDQPPWRGFTVELNGLAESEVRSPRI